MRFVLSVQEVAEYWGLDTETVYTKVRQGEIKGKKTTGGASKRGHWKIPMSSFPPEEQHNLRLFVDAKDAQKQEAA